MADAYCHITRTYTLKLTAEEKAYLQALLQNSFTEEEDSLDRLRRGNIFTALRNADEHERNEP